MAISLIDAVHSDGNLPICHIHGQPPFGYPASYNPSPPEIGINYSSETPELDFCHEIGHFLDHHGIVPEENGINYRASEQAEELEFWRISIKNSKAYKILEDSFYKTQSAFIDNLLIYRELWARSYAQYIAVKSGDQLLKRQLKNILNNKDHIEKNTQWSQKDFIPIMNQIDCLFKTRGWIL